MKFQIVVAENHTEGNEFVAWLNAQGHDAARAAPGHPRPAATRRQRMMGWRPPAL